MGLLERLKTDILVGDGAMGTLLYERGIEHQCFEEINITQPDQVISIHREYLQAGADVIQTNTYAANHLKLSKYGLEERTAEINRRAVALAKQAAADKAYVVGTIGGIRRFQMEESTLDEINEALTDQLITLIDEGVDGLLLETFYDLEEALMITKEAKKHSSLPLIVNVSLGDIGVMSGGIQATEAFSLLTKAGADIVGLNCRMGPAHMLRSFEEIPIPEHHYLAVYPNASLPDYRDGRLFYSSNPEYFANMTGRFIDQGVRLIGGCCGTSPSHIKAVAEVAKSRVPVQKKTLKFTVREPIPEVDLTGSEKKLTEIVRKQSSVIVELDPPKKLSTKRFMEGAHALKEAGIDALTLADNSLASPRIDNLALGTMVKEQVGMRPLVHLTCRDRNLIGLQSHLMGLHALGLNDVLTITGDPTKIGDFPGATSVYDLASYQLISMIKQLNEGISFSGKDLGERANFTIGAAFNPNVKYIDKAVKRLEKKIESGADYFMSQPVYDHQQLEAIYEETKHMTQPIYIGIMPLISARNAEFLHNEVPGIKLTDQIREAMSTHEGNREASKQEGLAIAKSLIDTAMDYFNGIYLITPFMHYDVTVELAGYINAKTKIKQNQSIFE
ncbi:bifunctional homocysteine S-methyltransferase/methylenetetrahydrofolate reductase [Alkalicoccobacillus porphyridii]|uniref:Bifunctional homocysteine S-methyltransferase/methylenetetrahydrofolate reductase n=1 Tax=Alkalicoccobacillus porphyridii TaxID=2597270 RepID=A0A553ZZM8_9BACI|nr:bifunctional homocysteine S-methyltransferase/methylenetetrahydrofolate reductase [Alkalicoccobacillus porphyridii]TSB46891.1 bifunctional homocysteine S-methyltransferase/methylenetetrahydrofolate reductase [Alkalicoccobacillus porphyridii]